MKTKISITYIFWSSGLVMKQIYTWTKCTHFLSIA